MKRFLTIIIAFLVVSLTLSAQTPIEKLMFSYDDVHGVNVYDMKGGPLMAIVRSNIRKSPMKPLADDVEEATILMMKKASDQSKSQFLSSLRTALKSYQFYGRKPGVEGNLVEVYGSPVKDGAVAELIIFNPEIYSLFSLRGSYSVAELKAMDK
jgi:hypothetical protein